MVRLLVLIFLAIASAVTALAGVRVSTPGFDCDDTCAALLQDLIRERRDRYFPVLSQPTARFDGPAATAACPVKRDGQASVHGLVMAPFYPKFIELEGTQNDAKLLRGFFTDRGVRLEFLRVLDGDQVSRAAMLAAMEASLACVRERDQVVFVFTGGSTSYARWFMPPLADFLEPICADASDDEEQQRLCAAFADPDNNDLAEVDDAYRRISAANDELVHFSSDTDLDFSNRVWNMAASVDGLTSAELSNFATQVRNRGADVFFILDTNFAAATNLGAYQKYAAPDGSWSWDANISERPPGAGGNPSLAPLFGTGHMAAIYATNGDQMALEGQNHRPVVLGNLIFSLTETMRTIPDAPLATLAEETARRMAELSDGGRVQLPVFEATSATMRLLAPRAAPPPREQDIEVIAPSPKRGAIAIEGKMLTVVARYGGAEPAYKAMIDGELVEVDGNGQFRRDVPDIEGKAAIQLRVFSKGWEQLATRAIILRDAPEEALLKSTGRRYALVISNDTYESEAFPPLKTPKADADVVADILATRFGFALSLPVEAAAPLDLRLENAGKTQILQTLFELRRRLVAEDQLLVYYAGHGENDPDLGAYWVPVDGQPGADFTWIAADEITRELKRMAPQAILVISDSCYAGGLSRAAAEQKPANEARERYLLKSSKLKSRQLMASGGEEPVEDAGGDGHSVFARALIDALGKEDEKAFTASELFEQRIKPAVISAANALSEGQTPGFHRIIKAGDEPGSEFVFVRAQ